MVDVRRVTWTPDSKVSNKKFLEQGYTGLFLWLGRYLSTGVRSESCSDADFAKIKELAPLTMLKHGYLFLKPSPGFPIPRRIIPDYRDQVNLVVCAHESIVGGHRGVDSTIYKLESEFYWPTLRRDTRAYVMTCDPCQRELRRRPRREIMATFPPTVMGKVHVDLCFMQKGKYGHTMFVEIRDDLSGFVYAKPVKRNTSRQVATVLTGFILLFGLPAILVADNGEIKTGEITRYLERAGIQVRFTAPFHAQSNAKVERGHQNLLRTVETFCTERPELWPEILPVAVLADNSSVRKNTGFTPFELFMGRSCPLPAGAELKSYRQLAAKEPLSRDELLHMRIEQLRDLAEVSTEAQQKLFKHRQESADRRNARSLSRPIKQGDLVYLLDTSKLSLGWRKLVQRWLGPYLAFEDFGNGTFRLAELDGTVLRSPAHSDRLKPAKERDKNLEKLASEFRSNFSPLPSD